MSEIQLDKLTKIFADGTVAVLDLDLEIQDGEFMVFVGPSGCGKTTALRMIAGLEDITRGTVSIGGRIVNDAAPNADGAPGDIFQTGDHAEGSCLAASRRTYKDHELAVLDLEIEIQDGDRAVGEDFGELIQLDLGHGSLLTL